MRFSLFVVALAAEGALASSWFTKAAYNKWHQTELERWLADNNVPFPQPADRKDLVDLVKNNWEANVVTPYSSWDTNQLSKYLSAKGQQVQKGTEQNKESLISQIKNSWTETADQATESYSSVKDWVFDSWTESQLKSFLDHNKITSPTPRTRDSLLQTVRSNYQAAADKLSEKAAYPGNWIYDSWSDSDLKAYLDERGIPVPQPNSRDKLIASVRRNAHVAAKNSGSIVSSLSASAASASASITDELVNTWSESQLKAWADKNGVKVPQGSKVNELRALVRKERSRLTGNNVSASATSAYGAATSSANNAFARATDDIYSQGKQWYDWSWAQIGLGSEEAKASISSASVSASSYASSVSKSASSYASSLSSVAEKSASSASKQAVKTSGDGVAAASSARVAATKSASSAAKVASASASSAAKVASSSAASAAKVASSSAASAAKIASSSAASAAKIASSSLASAASVAKASAQSGTIAAGSAAKVATEKVKAGASSVTARAKNEL